MAYIDLREKSRYLRELTVAGGGKALRPDEIDIAEEYADAVIEGKLGKSWESGSVPKLIEHIADLLGSAKAWNFVLVGQLETDGAFPKRLRDEAFELLKEIKSGEIGLKLPDGTWDEDFSGTNSEAEDGGGIEILI